MILLSDKELFLLNAKSLQLLHQIELSNVSKVSVTPYHDGIVVIHVNQVRDHLFSSCAKFSEKLLFLFALI